MDMDDDRTALININGEEYRLVLTTKATKEIGKRYGGLEKLGEKLMKPENFELAIDEIVWLITLLANQGIMIHNIRHMDVKKELLTEEYLELLTSPFELSTYKNAILDAMFRGTKRNVESEEPEAKNPQAG